jgi:hypothetical protein
MKNQLLRIAAAAGLMACLLSSCNEAAAQTQEKPKTEKVQPSLSKPCSGTAKTGAACKMKTKSVSGLCHWHDPEKIKARKEKAAIKK